MNANHHRQLRRIVKSGTNSEIVKAVSEAHHSTVIAAFKNAQHEFNRIDAAFAECDMDAPAYVTSRTYDIVATAAAVEAQEALAQDVPELVVPERDAINKFEIVKQLVKTYRTEVAKTGMGKALSAMMFAAKSHHDGYGLAADMVYTMTSKGRGAPKAVRAEIVRHYWALMVESAQVVNQAYCDALLLVGSEGAMRHAQPMGLHPVELRLGDAGTHHAFGSAEELMAKLPKEKDLLERLGQFGENRAAARALHGVWKEAPKWLQTAIIERAANPRFAEPDRKATVVENGERKVVKASAYRKLMALANGRLNGLSIGGAELAVRAALRLAMRYADSAVFWEGVRQPRQPSMEVWDEESYAGEEEKLWETPLRTLSLSGKSLGDRWLSQCQVYRDIAEDNAEAAEVTEAFIDKLVAVLEQMNRTIIYAYIKEDKVKVTVTGRKVADVSFIELATKEEAVEALHAQAVERNMKRIAESGFYKLNGAFDITGHAILADEYTAEQLAELQAL